MRFDLLTQIDIDNSSNCTIQSIFCQIYFLIKYSNGNHLTETTKCLWLDLTGF